MIKNNPKISICVPIHEMTNGDKFLWRLVNSLTSQTFRDWELIITKDGKMAENTNSGIRKARAEFVKILYLDDYFTNETALEEMMKHIEDYRSSHRYGHAPDWIICGTHNNQNPKWTNDIETGNNKLGSPSALIMRNINPTFFDEKLSWLLDCDLYKRLHERWGQPLILLGNYMTLGEGDHQMTHILTNEQNKKSMII